MLKEMKEQIIESFEKVMKSGEVTAATGSRLEFCQCRFVISGWFPVM